MNTLKNFFKKKSNLIMVAAIAVILIGGVIGGTFIQKEKKETLVSEVQSEERKEESKVEEDVTEEISEEKVENTEETSKKEETVKKEETSKKEETAKKEETSKKEETVKKEETSKKEETVKKEETSKKEETTKKEETSKKEETTKKEETKPVEKKTTCTIAIYCDSILSNMDKLKEGKEGLVPSSGCILSTMTVEFKEGETVFDVLVKACNRARIQLEYSYSPAYGSYYIEGINNLYEFDCGSSSGWKYKVNGSYPNYGCSSYKLSNGDVIVWTYTCTG